MKDKKIFAIPLTDDNPFEVAILGGMQNAAKIVGFDFRAWQTQLSPDQWTQGINKAVEEKYNLIDLVGGLPPEYIAPQIGEARSKGVKVVTTHDYDFTQTPPPFLDGSGKTDYVTVGKLIAAWTIAKTGGKVNALVFGPDEITPTVPLKTAILDYFKQNCPDCKTKYINTPAAEWATKIQPAVQDALLADPTINYVLPIYDSMSQFAAPAIQSANSKAKIVSYNGTPFVLDMMRDGDIVEMDVGEFAGLGRHGRHRRRHASPVRAEAGHRAQHARLHLRQVQCRDRRQARHLRRRLRRRAYRGLQEALGRSVNPAAPAARRAAGAPAGDALVVENLSKRFGGELALNGVNLAVRRGEVHGLLGANGSGKSTLIKILAGFHAPEPGGRMRLFGADLPLPVRADEAKALGLAFVHQNLALIPSLSLTENMRLTHFATAPDWRISWRRRTRVRRRDPRPLRIEAQSARARFEPLLRGAGAVRDRPRGRGPWIGANSAGRNRLLVLDEPTPFLPRVGVDQLFALVRRIVSEGASVIFVSHDIAEVMEITDRATILRDGLLVDVLETRTRVARRFRRADRRAVGDALSCSQARRREALDRSPHQRSHGAGPRPGRNRRRQRRNCRPDRADRLWLRPGMRRRLWRNARHRRPARTGGGRDHRSRVDRTAARDRGRARLSCRPIVLARPALADFRSPRTRCCRCWRRMRGRFGLDRRRMARTALELGAAFNVKPNAPILPLMALSGGNQQKALMAKWLQTKPRLILLDEPTQGVDVGARQQLLAALDAASLGGRRHSVSLRPTGSNWRRSATA